MIDNPLPDQVMQERETFYNQQEVEEVAKNHARIIAEHFKVHPDLFDHTLIYLDSDYIVDWWEADSYLYDDFDSPYMEITK